MNQSNVISLSLSLYYNAKLATCDRTTFVLSFDPHPKQFRDVRILLPPPVTAGFSQSSITWEYYYVLNIVFSSMLVLTNWLIGEHIMRLRHRTKPYWFSLPFHCFPLNFHCFYSYIACKFPGSWILKTHCEIATLVSYHTCKSWVVSTTARSRVTAFGLCSLLCSSGSHYLLFIKRICFVHPLHLSRHW